MPGFSITPVASYPPPTGEPFPVGIQWQDDGTNLGDRTVDTINLRDGIVGSRGSGETANVLTIDVASSPSAAAAAEPWAGRFFGSTLFDGTTFSAWSTVLENVASADFDLTGTTLTILRSGIYQVTAQVSFQPQVYEGGAVWPAGAAAYGLGLTDAFNELYSSPTRFATVGSIATLSSDNNRKQFTATWTLIVEDVDLPQAVLPYAFAEAPSEPTTTAFLFVTLTALRIGAV
jgi:hypothetical protein